ncbi:tetraacyldisaccharide 4'-kinase [Tenacibaculum sp. IB213877]|uniref:tetraacyldisaccharide 4'-kinase n=1 Tax=Tenacibaculum sp. IB213877 TaxID=3097351 RepID=UPI002A59DBFE|nr:tetraacyldisaccharide 4'-kinase [Tenacibaculum sp. IB213877]MDY0781091.1 tetraacyldisaccharide 4'-kinase [Tenacibaculum sp. IB213877]
MKLLRFLLFPFAVVYDFITTIRNWFFTIGVLKSTEFDIPVIAVGNLSVGGTGKTPQIEYLIRLLKNDYKIAVLSRGYKRKTKGFQLINDAHTAEDVGDEPLQFYKKYKNEITVAVDANRVNGISQLLKLKEKPDVVLLDDAYQHRKVKAKSYILLTKYNDLYVDDFLLPTGNLRESKRGVKRAELVVVTKCPPNLSKNQQKEIEKKLQLKSYQQLFFSTISYDERLHGSLKFTINELKNKQVLLVTGIANPNPLLEFLKIKEVQFTHLKFPDHHNFTSEDILKINTTFQEIELEDKLMLTTEKDFMRLKNKINELSYISIESVFLNNEEAFKTAIFNIIN